MTRRPRPDGSRREATADNVLAAVERLLAEGASYTELGVQQIAEAAGISRSTFYVHFTDKNDLLERLTRAATAELFDAAEQWVQGDVHDGVESLERALTEVCAQRRRHKAAMNALAEVAGYDPEIGRFWRDQIDGFASALAKRLAADRRAGHTRADLDAKGTATFLTWGVERMFEQHMIAGDPKRDAAVVKATAHAMWLAMYGLSAELA